ncbi:guanosine monophosphate reductase [Haladaptatus pallidirubidus]|uniref:IMP dehydrogenase n=1 Tax=Haladaptatus pallidirubidus TaxID=1008152 RepID=A0AAV3UL39_9EURY|nr:guanosine monophosphate reductase [Haladaptatus pallidirubidus]
MDIRTGLSYGDVLLLPQRSPVDSRSDVSLSTNLTPNLELDAPLVSAAMDTVTEAEAAIALSEVGGLGTLHRFMSIEEQAQQVRAVKDAGELVAAAVGINEEFEDRVEATLEAGVDCIMVDVAHGHMERCLDAVSRIDAEFPDAELVAGNVVTPEAVSDLYSAGADGVKVGVGPGSHCTTREVTGAGSPQLTAVDDCSEAAHDLGIHIVADGGIRTSGDAVKALMAGADTVMMGSFFAGTEEAPSETVTIDGQTFKRSRGMASTAANENRTDKELTPDADEGIAGLTEYKGSLADEVEPFLAGIRSGLSYCGGHDIEAARESAEFIQVAPSAREREGAHSVFVGVEPETEKELAPLQ